MMMCSSPGGKNFVRVAACDSVDQLFSQFRYNPTSSPPSRPRTPPPLTTTATNKKSRKGPKGDTRNNNEKKMRKKKKKTEEEIVDEEEGSRRKKKKKKKTTKEEIVDEEEGSRRKKKKKKKKRKRREKSVCLTSDQRWSEPYRRVPDDNNRWVPPSSPFGLLQEHYYHDPWKVLVICILCNRTRGSQTAKFIHEFFSLCPSAEATVDIPEEMIENKIRNLGLHRKRSLAIKRLSKEYLEDWAYVTQLHAVGKYAADAYAIFCSGHWRDVNPVDHKLVDYWKFLHDVDKTSTTC